MAKQITGYDFAGWATRNDIKCTDGRTIRDGAFAHCDGKTVPLVYQHNHNDINNVLGKVVLENVPSKGVRAYGFFNDTANGQAAREAVRHGDLTSLSVFANHLKQKMGDVLHGEIKEVSLVQAGANPGALIDVVISHADDDDVEMYDEVGIITTDETLEFEDELEHAEGEEGGKSSSGKTAQEIFDSMSTEQQNCCLYMMEKAVEMAQSGEGESEEAKHSDDDEPESDAEETEEESETKPAEEPDNTENSNEEENVEMKHNAFETELNAKDSEQMTLCHSFMDDLDKGGFADILGEAKSTGSTLSKVFLAHADEYGIENLDLLFPEYKNLDDMPQFIKRPDDWVSKIINGVKKVPFAKVRTLFADITADAARARGYTKGHKKVEEVISLLKREVNPTTVYKKQKLDRDDIVDLANLNIIGWLRQEMRMMLDEELARAFLVGDGRDPLSDDKIDEAKIIPMIFDDVLFTISKDTTGAAKNVIQTVIRSRKEYRGSGKPVFITTEDYVTEMMLMEDLNQRVIYETEDKLKTALRVTDIITSPILEGVENKAGTKELVGIVVNLADYCVGADRGGAINWFDDFDIDFNQNKYLIETRCSGALIKPKSCIVLWKPKSEQSNNEPAEEPANNG